ncbi:glycosyltransferase family 1 protein [Desulfosporosinus nitroreducens]|uniref:glycosyltransferase family 1 protein n=1 Tax=Desulfosporosinus nitroreducens TaxID=2018668 RepID=UPI00207C6A31|nr:glycosyltransferase family 1 protein [Desulfosporosinus nitroreducens]MCO1600973.1 glycosyltransferase family 1 protein [Desulfosporosinus nitroreducens]
MLIKKAKVLFFIDRMLTGGIQTLVMSLIKNMNRDVIQFDFLLLNDGKEYELENEIIRLGGNFYKVPPMKAKSIYKCIKAMNQFFKEHNDYVAIHAHSSSKSALPLAIAKRHGIKVRIAHSHNTRFQTSQPIVIGIGNLLKIPLRIVANYYFACSTEAGTWLFGKRATKQGKVSIIHNAIDLNAFHFDQSVRDRMRKKLNVHSDLVIGNVGRFEKQKNHDLLLNIFKEIKKREDSAILLLVGKGSLEELIKEKVDQLGLGDAVRFLGFRHDVKDLTQAMDIFVFPSLNEGLPVTGVEAQAVGLPCVFSDSITKEVKLLNETCYVSLAEKPEVWADAIIKIVSSYERSDTTNVIREKGFDIQMEAMKMEKFYLELKNWSETNAHNKCNCPCV